MKIRHLFLLCLIAISATLSANGKTVIPITTDDISLIYKVDDKNGRLYQSYLGQKLSFDSDIVQLPLGNEAYLTHGMEDYFEPAIRVLHNDGNSSLLLKYISHENKQLQPGVDEQVSGRSEVAFHRLSEGKHHQGICGDLASGEEACHPL